MDLLMIAITEVGNPVYHLIALAAASVHRPVRRAVRPYLLTCLVAFASALFFQVLIGRPRPEADAFIWPQPAMPSYPSGHTTAAAALAMLISLRHRHWPVWIGAAAWTVAVATSRVYLRHHHLDDVLGGAAFGAPLGLFGYGMTGPDQRGQRLRWFLSM